MVSNVVDRINRLDEKFLTKIEYDIYIEQVKHEIDEKLADKIGIKQLNETIETIYGDINAGEAKLQKQIDKFHKNVKKLQHDFLQVVEVSNHQTELLKEKVDFEEIEKL